MSWEEMRTKCVVCPCGQGKIEQKEYMDDWNRIEYSTPIIDCPICSKSTEYVQSITIVISRGMAIGATSI